MLSALFACEREVGDNSLSDKRDARRALSLGAPLGHGAGDLNGEGAVVDCIGSEGTGVHFSDDTLVC